jgi:arylsulfatase A-like enzyme
LTKDTIVFFMSDNGATHEIRADHRGRPYEGGSNKPFRAWKGSLFEGGMRVPAMIAQPGVLGPRVENSALAAMDLMPTILRMAGSTPPAEVDGADLSALLVKRAALPARTIFWDYEGQSAARSGDWKLLTSYREGLGQPMQKVPWLSNLASDPSESRNVASANPEVVARLTDAILTWRAKFK